jgi:hypothetical protein
MAKYAFIQSGHGLMVFQAQRVCKMHTENLNQKLKLKTLSGLRLDENTHQSVIIYSSEADAKEENAQRQEMRKKTISDTGHSMVEETMGEVLSIMSEV